jgi:hypothetical protein
VSDFGRLRSYVHFSIAVRALVWTAFKEPANVRWLIVCVASIIFAAWLAQRIAGKVEWVFAWPVHTACLSYYYVSKKAYHLHYRWSVHDSAISSFIYIQGVSQLSGITAGGDSLGLCDQKSSYKHVFDFERLRSYGHFSIAVHALVWTAFRNQLMLGGLSFALQALFLPPDSPRGMRGRWGGYSSGQCILHVSATTTCPKTLITYITDDLCITVTVPVEMTV